MSDLINISKKWKLDADTLLQEKGLIADLLKFGKVRITGAYSYNLMLHGDVDISVVREKQFSKEEVFEIFHLLYFQCKFRSYFIGGDWDDPRKGQEFPNGYYIGLKEKINNERWKFDIWFIDESEFSKRNNNPGLDTISDTQKELILQCKQYRNKQKISLSSQQIYNNVLSKKWENINDFKQYLQDTPKE